MRKKIKRTYYTNGKIVCLYIANSYGKFKTIFDYKYLHVIKKYKWGIKKNHNSFYVWVHCPKTKKSIFMHRLILNTPNGFFTDHINRDTLDNRIINLRVCTLQENNLNKNINKNNKSGFTGIVKVGKKWKAQTEFLKKYYHIGIFDTKEKAQKERTIFIENLRKELLHV